MLRISQEQTPDTSSGNVNLCSFVVTAFVVSLEVLFYIRPMGRFYLNGRFTNRKARKTFSVPNDFINLQIKL